MLGRAREGARLLRIKRPPLHAFKVDRCIATSGVGLLPRGATKYENRSERHERDNVDHLPDLARVGVETKSVSEKDAENKSSKAHEDMRSIDKVDPIVLKYTNFLNDLQAAKNVPEKLHVTNFGSIRFDEENIPKVHGQYDKTEEIDAKGIQEKHNIKDIVIPRPVDDSTMDVQNAGYMSEPTSLGNLDDHAKPEMLQFNELANEKSQSQDNYIDELVFSKAEEDFEKLNVMQETKHSTPKKPQVKDDGQNFVDDIYFKDAVENYDSIPQPKLQEDAKMTSESKFVENDSDKLHFIDSIFFKDSLDNLTSAEKSISESKYSEIEGDVMKSLNSKTATDFDNIQKVPIEVRKEENIGDPSLIQNQIKKNAPMVSDKEHGKKPARNSQTHQDRNETFPKNAYDFVVQLRKEERENTFEIGEEGARKNYKKVLSLLDEKRNDKYTKHEILQLLKRSIIYDKCK